MKLTFKEDKCLSNVMSFQRGVNGEGLALVFEPLHLALTT